MLQRGVVTIGTTVAKSLSNKTQPHISVAPARDLKSLAHITHLSNVFNGKPQSYSTYVPQPPPHATPAEIDAFEQTLKRIEESEQDNETIFKEMDAAWKNFTGLSLTDVESAVPDFQGVDELSCFDVLPSALRKEATQGHYPNDTREFAKRIQTWAAESQLSEKKQKEAARMVQWLNDCASHNFGFSCSEPKLEEELDEGEEEDEDDDDDHLLHLGLGRRSHKH